MDDPKTSNSIERLVNHLVLVGPGHGVTFEPILPPSCNRGTVLHSWHNITTPTSSILRRFPSSDHSDCVLANDVVYFCQPEGCCVELTQPKTHVFMLTDTETNIRTYGVCLTIPHLFDPHKSHNATNPLEPDSICIQEWGVLSICILSHHPFFNFFAKCLKTLSHFMEHFGTSELKWNALIHAQYGACAENSSSRVELDSNFSRSRHGSHKASYISEVEEWINNLLLLPAPVVGGCGLEVELEVDPAVLVCYPPKNRLPMLDLPLHQVVKKIGIHLVIEIFKLVLSEQKVILHSSDPTFSSECVLCIISLLYPFQYLYPVIPLLPSSMKTAENLLMVPTPFLIGVCDSFMKKVKDYQISEVWAIALDTKQIKQPPVLDQPLLKFPYSILQLQADVRKAMDKINKVSNYSTPISTPQGTFSSSFAKPLSPSPSPSPASPILPLLTLGEDHPDRFFLDEIDVTIRIAFVQFLYDPEILGLIAQHLCIYRLFPRPVVTLRNSAFLSAYRKSLPDLDTGFIQQLIKTQCVEYFFECSLNPSSLAFEEIRRGVTDPSQLSDKYHYFIRKSGITINQASLYSHSPESLLYQEMLNYKANSSHYKDQSFDDSDWEVLSGEYYDGGSEISGSSDDSFYSDNDSGNDAGDNYDSRPQLRKKTLDKKRLKGKSEKHISTAESFQEDVEVGYFTPDNFSKSSEEVVNAAGVRRYHTSNKYVTPGGAVGNSQRPALSNHNTLKVNILKSKSVDFDDSSTRGFSEDWKLNLTPDYNENDSSLSSDTETKHRPKKLFDNDKIMRTEEYLTPGLGSGLRRGGSLVVRGEGSVVNRTVQISSPSGSSSSRALESQIQELVRKIMDGQGLPWPKPAYLKRLACQEKTRIFVLRLLEEKLGVREPGEMMMATNHQIIAVSVTKPVFKGIMDLLRYLILCLEEEFHREPEAPIFSIFLILRIAFSTYLPPKQQKSTIGVSLLNALNLSSFVTPSPDTSQSSSTSPLQSDDIQPKSRRSRERELASRLPKISISDTDEETEELHILRHRDRLHSRRSSSPLVVRRMLDKTSPGVKTQPSDLSEPVKSINEISTETGLSPGDGVSDANDVIMTQSPLLLSPVNTTPASSTPSDLDRELRFSPVSLPTKSTPLNPLKLPPMERSDSPPPQSNSDNSQNKIPTSPPNQAILLSELINSPRFYHPQEGQDLSGCSFLYKELMNGLGHSQDFMLSREFWNQVFISTVTVDRENLGWNEQTASLYTRYNSLSESHRQTFGFEEDSLLSAILHNLLVYMLMVGLTPHETTENIHRFSARTRLAIIEEKLLQRTMKHIEECIEEDASHEVDINMLGLMALYSEVHPTVSYIVHYGLDILAPVYKLQITDEVLTLRRFPDDRIYCRLWNDSISVIKYSKVHSTVSICHKDSSQVDYYHHFHTKQYKKVYESLQTLVSLGRLDSESSSPSTVSPTS